MHTPNTRKYNSATDRELMIIGGVPDGSGRYLDIHETLFHSESEGFYRERRIRQVLRGRAWETPELGGLDRVSRSTRTRFLKVHRRMSREEVMRYVIEVHMPETGGLREETLRILDQVSGRAPSEDASTSSQKEIHKAV
jgi:hypothetical protein